jgi:hypothetical protein
VHCAVTNVTGTGNRTNLYVYVNNDPLNGTDSTGLASVGQSAPPNSPANIQIDQGTSNPASIIQVAQEVGNIGTLVTSFKTSSLTVVGIYDFGGIRAVVPIGQRIAPPALTRRS